MKLRVVILGLAVLAGSCLPGRSQQQLSQIATVTLNLGQGWNAISVPLGVGSNTLNELFPDMPNGSQLAKYNRALDGYDMFFYNPDQRIWLTSAGAPGGTLKPGEGAFLHVTTALTLTISGLRVTPHALLDAGFGTNFVGCQTLAPCTFEELMGFAPRPGDVVFQYDRPVPNQPQAQPPEPGQGATRTNRFGTTGWDVDPVIPVGKGVFVVLANRPRVMVDPIRLNVPINGSAEFTAIPLNAAGDLPTNLQWRFQGNAIPGQRGFMLILTNVQASDVGNYSVIAQFASGSVTSVNARLMIAVPPVITKEPQSLTVTQGHTAVFSVQASGTPPLFYQWMRGPLVITPFAQERTSLVISNAGPQNAGLYRVIVTNVAGFAVSTQAALNVLSPPFIRVHPSSEVVNPGATVTLKVEAEGTGPLAFQWLLNGNPIEGATGASFTISAAQADQSGAYRVIVSNPVGAVMSDVAIVKVLTQDIIIMSDSFPGISLIPTVRGVAEASNTLATLEPGEPRHAEKTNGHSIWISFSPPVPGIMTLNTRGSSFDTVLAVYVGRTITELMEVASDDDAGGFLSSIIRFSAEANQTYHIVVAGHGESSGRAVLSWDFETTPDVLPIFTEHPKTQVVPFGFTAVFRVSLSIPDDGLQWFFNGKPLPNQTQSILQVPGLTTNVGLYHVSVRAAGRLIDSRAAGLEIREIDGPGQPLGLRSEDKYQDLVDGLADTSRAAGFIPASAVLGYTGSQTFATVGAGGEIGEPVHCDVVGGHSKWYAYIPPASGTLFLNTDGSDFDTLLAVYTGCCNFSSLTPVECDNNSGTNGLTSSLSFQAASNTVYYLAVDGPGGATGNVKLNYRLLVPMLITNLAKTTNSMTFLVKGTPAWPATVQVSTNCLAWTNMFTTGTVSGTFTFLETNLPSGRRFYRSMQTP